MVYRNPYYGVDAPAVVRTMLFAAAGLIAFGFLVSQAKTGVFWVSGVGWFFVALSAIPLTLGLSMLAYAGAGKFAIRDFMLGKIAWRGDETVLDVGTGRGLLAVGAAMRLTTGKAIGIDIWKPGDLSGNGPLGAMTNAAIERVENRVETKTEDAQSLSFPANTFDAVFSLLCLHNIEGDAGRDRACSEIARVLKPGGTVVIGDYVPVGAYGAALKSAGLDVGPAKSHFRKARGPLWIVSARKPASDAAIMGKTSASQVAELVS